MKNFAFPNINSVTLKNFKSLKSVTLHDCRRINVLIGRPNVGKSNILEALAMFDVPYMLRSANKSLKNIIRIENTADIFHNGLSTSPAEVITDDNTLIISRTSNNGLSVEILSHGEQNKYSFSSALSITNKKDTAELPNIIAYFFPKYLANETSNIGYLLPPSGANLMETVANLPELKSKLAELFHSYGLKMMFDSGSQQIKAVRENGMDMFLIPFSSLADSLQRLIFYKSAIKSNENKVICFEEPEAHTFPPYITSIVNDILDSDKNQFFITTHSPYVISSLLENAGDDLAIFIVDMDNNDTVVKRLTDIQLQEAYDNGIDMFYNIETYLDK